MNWLIAITLIVIVIDEIRKNPKKLKKWFSPTKYLNYNPLSLCNVYQDETPIEPYVPYKEEVCWIRSTWQKTCKAINNVSIQRTTCVFKLMNYPVELKTFQSQALSEFRTSGKMNRDSDIIRLQSLVATQEGTELTIQKAKYSDQVQSNLVMDWTNKHALQEGGITTLRAYFSSQYSKRLPPLSERRLANTIGIAVILFYQNSFGQYIPYLPLRQKGIINHKKILAVHEGGYHCTASGATEWSGKNTFSQIFTENMYRELHVEVGIEKGDVKIMLPIALCREFLRAGKPQIFFAGLTTLSEAGLAERRRLALQKQKALPDKIEIKNKALIVSDIDQLKEMVHLRGLSLEAIANLHYATKFIKQYPG